MKDWFPHDYYSSKDLALVRLLRQHGATGYGVFWATIEILHSNTTVHATELLDVLCHMFSQTDSQPIESVLQDMVNFGLLHQRGDGTVYSRRVESNKEVRDAVTESKRSAAVARWRNPKQAQSKGNQERGGFVLNGGSPIPPMVNGMFVVVDDATKEYAQSISNAGAMQEQQTAMLLHNNTRQDITDNTITSIEPVQDSVIELPCTGARTFHVKQSEVDQMVELYPNVDILAELRKMKGWLLANAQRRKTPRGTPRFIHNWLAKQQDHGNGQHTQQHSKVGERSSKHSATDYDATIRAIAEGAGPITSTTHPSPAELRKAGETY